MAEIAQDSGGKGGKKRSKKMSTRIDMTPMVDLGFLLITFFVLVTTFSKPSAMDLKIPAKEEKDLDTPPPVVKESKVLQLVLGPENRLYWYRGAKDPKVDSIDFSQSSNVQPVIQEVREKIRRKWGHDSVMIVLIKPMKQSKYKNLVDILDEMAINKVQIYTLMDFKAPADSITLWKGRQPNAGSTSDLENEATN
jgi:biopolymer transport protein ExbD